MNDEPKVLSMFEDEFLNHHEEMLDTINNGFQVASVCVKGDDCHEWW